MRDDARVAQRERTARRHVESRLWIEAQQAWRGKAFYPDANSTLRVSAASVKGYSPRDGVVNTPFTTLTGILRKETGEEPFANPKSLLQASENAKSSRFFDQVLGDIPVCFLADGDTTGGNSGSPVINGRGQLVGLNFDRVFENVAGDFGWNADRSRNICVDIRYVLWNLEQVQPAPHLLKELGFN
ncbi:MAG TPA: S46 family peptidase, partial [Planctomycetota bacterium]|nr:S46 family peptidase [Planctomycetota bacterium]